MHIQGLGNRPCRNLKRQGCAGIQRDRESQGERYLLSGQFVLENLQNQTLLRLAESGILSNSFVLWIRKQEVPIVEVMWSSHAALGWDTWAAEASTMFLPWHSAALVPLFSSKWYFNLERSNAKMEWKLKSSGLGSVHWTQKAISEALLPVLIVFWALSTLLYLCSCPFSTSNVVVSTVPAIFFPNLPFCPKLQRLLSVVLFVPKLSLPLLDLSKFLKGRIHIWLIFSYFLSLRKTVSLFHLCVCFGGLWLCPEQLTWSLEYRRCLLNVARVNDTDEYFTTHLCLKFLKNLGSCWWLVVVLKVEMGDNSERIGT